MDCVNKDCNGMFKFGIYCMSADWNFCTNTSNEEKVQYSSETVGVEATSAPGKFRDRLLRRGRGSTPSALAF